MAAHLHSIADDLVSHRPMWQVSEYLKDYRDLLFMIRYLSFNI